MFWFLTWYVAIWLARFSEMQSVLSSWSWTPTWRISFWNICRTKQPVFPLCTWKLFLSVPTKLLSTTFHVHTLHDGPQVSVTRRGTLTRVSLCQFTKPAVLKSSTSSSWRLWHEREGKVCDWFSLNIKNWLWDWCGSGTAGEEFWVNY